MNQPKSIIRFMLIAVAAVAVLALAPQRAEAQDSFAPGPSAGQPEISKDGKTETFKDKDGHVTEVREYTDKTRTHKRTTEEIKEYHKNGKPKKVVRTFHFREEPKGFTGGWRRSRIPKEPMMRRLRSTMRRAIGSRRRRRRTITRTAKM